MPIVPLRSRPVAGLASPRVLLVTPPMTQLNTPYPATTFLTGLLLARGIPVAQADLSLETALALLSRPGLERLFAAIRASPHARRPEAREYLARASEYTGTVDAAVRFLQGRDPSFVARILQGVLPEGPRARADQLDEEWAFGALGATDRARRRATLYLYDLADLAHETVAPRFELSRYAESLAIAARSFDGLADALAEPPGLIDRLCEETLLPHLDRAPPDLLALTAPFPGNLYGALRIAQAARRRLPGLRIALGGGYVNTELRELAEPRLFDLIDFLVFDDGERPLLALIDHLSGGRPTSRLVRTMLRERGAVVRCDGGEPDLAQAELPAPSYLGLPLERYVSVLDSPNPMQRLWSDGRWSKLLVAHGCYWKRCTFCDVGLDYIARYEPLRARALADRIDALEGETGGSGFHFVDEAAPPGPLIELALELLRRGRAISFWGNIRFEKSFTPDVCRLLAAAGCIAVSGGLEVASDRLLALIDKGVTVAQVARVAAAFTSAGVLVHAYLMHGFPSETAQDTVDSLERVRQLFAAGAIDSAFWHRFTLTRHAPIAADPARFGITILDGAPGPFANNDLRHLDPVGADPARFADGLRAAVYNYMHDLGLDRDVRGWFPGERLRPTRVAPDAIERAIADRSADPERSSARLVWIGPPVAEAVRAVAGGLELAGLSGQPRLSVRPALGRWIVELLDRIGARGRRADAPYPRRTEVAASFPGGAPAFARFARGRAFATLRRAGLLELG